MLATKPLFAKAAAGIQQSSKPLPQQRLENRSTRHLAGPDRRVIPPPHFDPSGSTAEAKNVREPNTYNPKRWRSIHGSVSVTPDDFSPSTIRSQANVGILLSLGRCPGLTFPDYRTFLGVLCRFLSNATLRASGHHCWWSKSLVQNEDSKARQTAKEVLFSALGVRQIQKKLCILISR